MGNIYSFTPEGAKRAAKKDINYIMKLLLISMISVVVLFPLGFRNNSHISHELLVLTTLIMFGALTVTGAFIYLIVRFVSMPAIVNRYLGTTIVTTDETVTIIVYPNGNSDVKVVNPLNKTSFGGTSTQGYLYKITTKWADVQKLVESKKDLRIKQAGASNLVKLNFIIVPTSIEGYEDLKQTAIQKTGLQVAQK